MNIPREGLTVRHPPNVSEILPEEKANAYPTMKGLGKKDAEASQTQSGCFGTLRYALTPIPYASPRGLPGGSRATP